MSNFWSIIDVFSKKRERKILRDEDDRALFIRKYQAFRSLLQHNNSALLTMGDMQEKAGGGFVFDRAYIRASYDALAGDIWNIIEGLNVLTDDGSKGLRIPYETIDAAVRGELAGRAAVPETDFVLPLDAVRKKDHLAAGGKFSSLGELASALGEAVPPGFVITAHACKVFAGENGLEEFLRERADRFRSRRYEEIEAASLEVAEFIRRGRVPPDLETAVLEAYRSLVEQTGRPGLRVAVRSSELHEDVMASFAGQYESALNVPGDGIMVRYRDVLASQFTPRALLYYRNRGFDMEEMAMAVGVMAMVDAAVSGIVYSRDPKNPLDDTVLINAVRGLGPYAVEGAVPADNFVVSGGRILREAGPRQEVMLEPAEEGGTRETPVPLEQLGKPSLDNDQIVRLAKHARDLEDRFHQPQDIEWAMDPHGRLFFLQSRPLRLSGTGPLTAEKRPRVAEGQKILIDRGTVACQGVGAGPVHMVLGRDDLAAFPQGGVLVIRHTLPEYAAVLHKASAVVSDIGTTLGHLATVAREYNVPAIFNTENATQVLQQGMVVTVDAVYATVYEGSVAEVLREKWVPDRTTESPAVMLLRTILRHITPLNLTDPRKPEFSPSGCRTFHDITRYAHELALKAIFELSKESHFAEHSAKQLVSDVPLKWWVIDLEDGTDKGVTGKKIRPEEIVSVPMRALWQGMIALPWKGPPPVDAKGFMSLVLSASTDPSIDPAVGQRFADKNYILVARNFCNVSTRLGFHFSTIEAFIGDQENQNYISFVYTGGGADAGRKERRAVLISRLLEQFDFRVEKKGDSLFARMEGFKQALLEDRMEVLGYIIVHTRQMDMVMFNDAMVDFYFKDMMKEIKSGLFKEAS